MAMLMSDAVERTLQRVLSLATDEMMKLAWTLQADLRGVAESTAVVIQMSRDAEEKQRWSEAVKLWLIKLEEVANAAEDVLDELSYEILRRKVHNNSLGYVRFLKCVVYNFKLGQRVKNLNRVLDAIKFEAEHHLGLLRIPIFYFPFRLRLCSLFCSSFPNYFLFQTTELIQLWMAAGLIESTDEGIDCFSSLVSNSDLKGVEMDEDGNVVVCKIRGFEHMYSRNYDTLCARYLYAATSMAIPNNLSALILDGVPFEESWKLGRLEILVFLNNVDIEVLPSSIERLKHLRYLDVSDTRIRALPEFITELYNLQTLRFLRCKELNELPRQFNNLINLKNIAFSFEHQMPFGLGLLICLQTLSFFVVGSNRGGSITELRYLNGLRGHMEITRLEEVIDKKEAETANLQQKEKLDGLSFQWSYGARNRTSSDEEVLEGLRPHSHIRKVAIKNYMGEKWPLWMWRTRSPSNGDSFVLHNLVCLTLERCWNCKQLPCLEDLPYLKFLTIQHMEKVKCIYNELCKENDSESSYSPRCLFPALKSLSLSWMENLSDWSSGEKSFDDKKAVVLPRLETLSIQCCAKLTSFPLEDLSTLVKIDIKDCHELRFLFHKQQSFPSLAKLSIEGCPKLTHLPNRLPSNTHFKGLRVRRCEWLMFVSENLGRQSSLPSLEINCCKGLTFFSDEILCKLTRLRKLSIGAFSEKLDDFGYLNRIKELPRLEELEIWGSDFFGRKMCHLPDQLQHLANLESLKIMGFTAMESLPEWLSDLQSLQCLSLNYCWQLEYQSTTTIIQRLPNLKQLYVSGCHTLEQNKSQWNEFSRITNIRVHFS